MQTGSVHQMYAEVCVGSKAEYILFILIRPPQLQLHSSVCLSSPSCLIPEELSAFTLPLLLNLFSPLCLDNSHLNLLLCVSST